MPVVSGSVTVVGSKTLSSAEASFIVPRALSIFSIIVMFIGIPGVSLCGGEKV